MRTPSAPATMSPSKAADSPAATSHFRPGSPEHGHVGVGVLPVEVDERLVELAERRLLQPEPSGHAGVDEHEGPVSHGPPDATVSGPWPRPSS